MMKNRTDKIDLSKLAKILGKLGTDSDEERDVVIKQILAMMKAGKCNWQDVLKEAPPKPRKHNDTAGRSPSSRMVPSHSWSPRRRPR
jgi:hypothetical protein